MRLWRILICKIFLLLILLSQNVSGKYIALKVGVYDFTSEFARDFYKTSPLLLVSSNLLEMSRIDMNLTTGITYTWVRYNKERHTLTMVPVFVTMIYNLPNVGSRVKPYFGSGMGFLAKYDKNDWLSESHKNYTYGYHVQAGFKIQTTKRIVFAITMQYNSFTPPINESSDVSGVTHTLDIRYNLGKLLKKIPKD